MTAHEEIPNRASVLYRGEAWTVVAQVTALAGPDVLHLVRLRIAGGDDEIVVDPAKDSLIVCP